MNCVCLGGIRNGLWRRGIWFIHGILSGSSLFGKHLGAIDWILLIHSILLHILVLWIIIFGVCCVGSRAIHLSNNGINHICLRVEEFIPKLNM